MTETGGRFSFARLAVRGLVVAGFAGVAWLLSSSVAHASPAASTVHGGNVVASLLGLPYSATETVQHVTGNVIGSTLVPRLAGSTAGTHDTTSAAAAKPAVKSAVPRKAAGRPPAATVVQAGPAPASASTSSIKKTSTVTRARPEVTAQRLEHAPLLPRPAPAPPQPGTGMTGGAENTGSGAGQSSGVYAIASTATAFGSVADHRPETAADSLVRPLIAERPTVSPD
jgi:hypothetical protein